MMITASRSKLVTIFFVAALLAAVSVTTYSARQRTRLEANLTRAARMYRVGYASHIILRDFTEFGWDQMYIFPPGTSDQLIFEALGFYWPEARTNRLLEERDRSLLLFTRADEIVQWVEMPGNLSDYASIADRAPFTPETALFFLPFEDQPTMQILR
jgi:hypothetical protein